MRSFAGSVTFKWNIEVDNRLILASRSTAAHSWGAIVRIGHRSADDSPIKAEAIRQYSDEKLYSLLSTNLRSHLVWNSWLEFKIKTGYSKWNSFSFARPDSLEGTFLIPIRSLARPLLQESVWGSARPKFAAEPKGYPKFASLPNCYNYTSTKKSSRPYISKLVKITNMVCPPPTAGQKVPGSRSGFLFVSICRSLVITKEPNGTGLSSVRFSFSKAVIGFCSRFVQRQ